ncbi:hypothetical protein [Paraburkholderia lycopersici]|uniref:hypothetical protein n=1 Tax=Paraburkholderia lycopersici TaxID=416944 RepID=UPI000B81644C|nr:hypothetical protein [Paraburkholderia lycopersici]
MDDADDKGKSLTVPHTTGKGFFVFVLLFLGFIVISALHKGHLPGTTGTTVTIALCSVIGLLGLLSKEVCVFTSDPRSMRVERWIVDRRVHTKPIDIDAVRWIRSRWTGQGITLELGAQNSWNTIEVQTTYLSRQEYGLGRGEQESRVNGIRASVAQLLDISDAGWETHAS